MTPTRWVSSSPRSPGLQVAEAPGGGKAGAGKKRELGLPGDRSLPGPGAQAPEMGGWASGPGPGWGAEYLVEKRKGAGRNGLLEKFAFQPGLRLGNGHPALRCSRANNQNFFLSTHRVGGLGKANCYDKGFLSFNF